MLAVPQDWIVQAILVFPSPPTPSPPLGLGFTGPQTSFCPGSSFLHCSLSILLVGSSFFNSQNVGTPGTPGGSLYSHSTQSVGKSSTHMVSITMQC